MTTYNTKITHLFHSGYAVQTKDHFMIFDYYQPLASKKQEISAGILTSEYLKTKKNVLVFVSHNHGDHFDPTILDWVKDNPDITYILSSDVQTNTDALPCSVVSAYQSITIRGAAIKTFGSTDQGISFFVQVDGVSIFHAGDLNWWHWSGESLQEQRTAESAFKAEMEKLAETVKGVDIAFFPVDRRMEEFYSIGAEYFAKQCKPKLLVPMHFGNDFATTTAFAEKAKKLSIATVEITHQGQEIFF